VAATERGLMPKPPKGTRAAGKRLWASILGEYELEEHELALLREMTRIVDRLDLLAAEVAADGVVIRGAGLEKRAHPGLVEARQQQIALARLAAALRLPAGDQDVDAKSGMRRPQRRASRGVYGIRGSVA
jgi:hypothetical protein